jgi:hypothetical protein
VFRVGALLGAFAFVAGVTPSFAQSLESQGYRYSKRQDSWVSVPAYLQPLAEGDSEFIKFLTLQDYYFNRAENTWEPLGGYLVRSGERTVATHQRRGRALSGASPFHS